METYLWGKSFTTQHVALNKYIVYQYDALGTIFIISVL